jgi:hypothetical protein
MARGEIICDVLSSQDGMFIVENVSFGGLNRRVSFYSRYQYRKPECDDLLLFILRFKTVPKQKWGM